MVMMSLAGTLVERITSRHFHRREKTLVDQRSNRTVHCRNTQRLDCSLRFSMDLFSRQWSANAVKDFSDRTFLTRIAFGGGLWFAFSLHVRLR
jgi:hypothetical protein